MSTQTSPTAELFMPSAHVSTRASLALFRRKDGLRFEPTLAIPTLQRCPHSSKQRQPRSGNIVVALAIFSPKQSAKALGDAGRTTKAVEMEAKGFCEALDSLRPKPPTPAVRGMSDVADEEKSLLERRFRDGWRRHAAQNAARFLLGLIYRRPEIADD